MPQNVHDTAVDGEERGELVGNPDALDLGTQKENLDHRRMNALGCEQQFSAEPRLSPRPSPALRLCSCRT